MNTHSIGGLVLLNLLFLGVGEAALWALCGFRAWGEVARLVGVAYLLGVATLGSMLALELIVGIPFGLAGTLVTAGLIALVGVAWGIAVGRPLPSLRGNRYALPRISLITAASAALAAVYLEALFRSGRLRGLYEFDAWSIWVPKAKAIYFFGGLDHQLFRELPGPTYPPLVPGLEAAAFHFMGSADVITLHLQFWFFYVGFVAAIVGLLAPRVRPALLWPFVVLLLAMPDITKRALQPQADLVLGELFVVGALLFGLWLTEKQRWQLAAAALLLAAAAVAKREGQLEVACVGIAAIAFSWKSWRAVWRQLAIAAAVVATPTLAWIAWYRENIVGVRGTASAAGSLVAGSPVASDALSPAGIRQAFTEHADRGWPSLELTISTFVDYDLWLVAAPVVLLALALAFFAGSRRLAGYVTAVGALSLAGFTMTTWAVTDFPITKDPAVNPIIRLVGTTVLLCVVTTPLLLQSVWDARWKGER